MHGMCQYESLKNGALDLCDVALMNEYLDVTEENRVIAERLRSTQ